MKKVFTLLLFLCSSLAFVNAEGSGSVKVGLNVGNKAPEIKELSINGDTLSLSSLKGKIVLIDFWASWCSPCRHENPHVVRTYNQFKDKDFKNGKGFTVYSISLDKSKDSWETAVKNDNLSWDNHVSDLKWWNSKYARVYQIRSIPSNFLIDGEGVILAKNLRGEDLYNFLKNLEK